MIFIFLFHAKFKNSTYIFAFPVMAFFFFAYLYFLT